MRVQQETEFRWPEDGNAVNITRDALASVSMPEIVDCVLPALSGKAVLAAWMLATGADAHAVRRTLNITTETLRAYCGAILEATQAHSGETIILPVGGKP